MNRKRTQLIWFSWVTWLYFNPSGSRCPWPSRLREAVFHIQPELALYRDATLGLSEPWIEQSTAAFLGQTSRSWQIKSGSGGLRPQSGNDSMGNVLWQWQELSFETACYWSEYNGFIGVIVWWWRSTDKDIWNMKIIRLAGMITEYKEGTILLGISDEMRRASTNCLYVCTARPIVPYFRDDNSSHATREKTEMHHTYMWNDGGGMWGSKRRNTEA